MDKHYFFYYVTYTKTDADAPHNPYMMVATEAYICQLAGLWSEVIIYVSAQGAKELGFD